MTGLGLSLRVGELAEFYASGSAFLPRTQFLTSAVGARFDLANGFELGVGAVFVGGGGGDQRGLQQSRAGQHHGEHAPGAQVAGGPPVIRFCIPGRFLL